MFVLLLVLGLILTMLALFEWDQYRQRKHAHR